jgi:steroid delta-isomerase-like uncharacterized protein
MTREEIEILFARRRDAVARLDAPALAALHSERSVVDSPAGGTHTGREAIEHVYRAWFAAFPDFKVLSEQLVLEGDTVAAVMTMAGTDVGGFMGLPPTGRHFQFPGVFVFTVENGEIVREQRIYDFTGMLVQIGVLKVKPASDIAAAVSRKDSQHAN